MKISTALFQLCYLLCCDDYCGNDEIYDNTTQKNNSVHDSPPQQHHVEGCGILKTLPYEAQRFPINSTEAIGLPGSLIAGLDHNESYPEIPAATKEQSQKHANLRLANLSSSMTQELYLGRKRPYGMSSEIDAPHAWKDRHGAQLISNGRTMRSQSSSQYQYWPIRQ